MNVQINQLVKSLLQKDSIEECSVKELRQFADRHPYFGAAQLLLTKKLQTENKDQYNEQLQKTFLFFHNPLWVEQLLNETGQALVTKAEPAKDDSITIPDIFNAENSQTGETKPEPEYSDPNLEETKTQIPTLLSVPGTTETITGPEVPDAAEPLLAEMVMERENSGNKMEEPIMDIPTLRSATVETEKEEMVFEPLYTVDYFASQGIKFREEENPKDKLGRQLKSFTDWLRTMKRLPLAEIRATGEPKLEEKVEQLAEHSLEDKEVITESMAEVWEKQGNAAKAIDIYTKLSLLDPAKSAYFASKIEDLKKSI